MARIEEAARRGWPILMKDKRIRYRPAEITAVTEHGARCFVIPRGDLPSADMAHRFITNKAPTRPPYSPPRRSAAHTPTRSSKTGSPVSIPSPRNTVVFTVPLDVTVLEGLRLPIGTGLAGGSSVVAAAPGLVIGTNCGPRRKKGDNNYPNASSFKLCMYHSVRVNRQSARDCGRAARKKGFSGKCEEDSRWPCAGS